MRALLIEPYASSRTGGSWMACTAACRSNSNGSKCRLQMEVAHARGGASPRSGSWNAGPPADVLFCSAYLALTDLVALGPEWVRRARKVVYFHENQFVYPKRLDQEWDFHFALTNVTTALAADAVAFNSRYNRDSFFEALPVLLKRFPDFRPLWVTETIAARPAFFRFRSISTEFENLPCRTAKDRRGLSGITAGNTRQKPGGVFRRPHQLDQSGVDFELAVMGQQFQDRPPSSTKPKNGWPTGSFSGATCLPAPNTWRAWPPPISVASTAIHEFF